MFVRAKTVKGKKYGYLVENTWKRGKVKQVVKKYLGRVVTLDEPVNESSLDVDFSQKLEDERYGRADIFRTAWISDYPSPDNFLFMFYGKDVPESLDEPFPLVKHIGESASRI